MPIYEYKCECRPAVMALRLSLKDYEKCIRCASCGELMKQLVSLPGQPDCGFKPYVSENMTRQPVYIKSRAHKKKLMKLHGVIEAG